MKFYSADISDVKIIQPKIFGDQRGSFLESYRQDLFNSNEINDNFVQDNLSESTQAGVIRGLHFQLPYPQAKLVSVIKGEVLDIAVDLRVDSPTFGSYTANIVSDKKRNLLYVPVGFAHGFLTLSDYVLFAYKCSQYYHPESEHTLAWDDKDLAIDWKLKTEPIISNKDKMGLSLKDYINNFKYQYKINNKSGNKDENYSLV